MKPIFEQFGLGRYRAAAAPYRRGMQLHALCMFHPTQLPTLTTFLTTWGETSGTLR